MTQFNPAGGVESGITFYAGRIMYTSVKNIDPEANLIVFFRKG